MVGTAFAGTVAFAVGGGLATFFAPCAYPLLPGYVGYYLGREEADLGGAFARGTAATVGALAVLAAFGALLFVVGQRTLSRLGLLEPVVGAGLIALGALVLVGRAPSLHVVLPERRASVAGFALFGGVYAVAAAGCVVPVALGVLAQALALPPGQAAVALAAYAASVALPLLVVTLLAALGGDLVRGASRYVGPVERVAGAAMILAGAWQVYGSLRYLGYL